MSTTPNADLQRYLDQAGIHPTGTNWNQIDPNVSGITGALNVDALNRIASSRTQSTVGGTAPTPSGTGSPTSSGTGSNFEFSGFGLSPDPHMEEAARYAKQWESDANMVIDQNQIYNNQMRMFQAEIDAVNQLYGNMLTQAQREGTGRLGSTTAMSARAGTLGSDFGMAQHEQTAGFNREIEGGIRAENAARIQAIMGNVRSSVAREMAEKRAAKEAGAQNYLEFLRHSSERRTSRSQQLAQTILMQDQDPETLNWDEILKGSDIDKNDVMNFYTQAKQERDAQQAEANYKRAQEEAKMELDQRKVDIDEAYKTGTLTLKEREMLLKDSLGWYSAQTSRINADANMLNATKNTTQSDANFESRITKMTPTYKGQTLTMDAKRAEKLQTEFGITSAHIIQVQEWLNRGYDLQQIAKATDMPTETFNALNKYVK
jgi:hypothetical protein